MSQFLSQQTQSIRRGCSAVSATVVRLTAKSDTVELPTMIASSNSVVQLRRPHDPLVTVSQDDLNTVSLTGKIGDEILLVSLHNDPVPEPR